MKKLIDIIVRTKPLNIITCECEFPDFLDACAYGHFSPCSIPFDFVKFESLKRPVEIMDIHFDKSTPVKK